MLALPDFPWDRLIPYAATARAHRDGIVDLSVGTPVDPTPAVVQQALAAASDAPGYPLTVGTAALREAAAAWLGRVTGVAVDPAQVLPSIGSKGLVALLPTLLGLGPGQRVLFPGLAYPTYDVGARLAGCEPVPVAMADGLIDVEALDPADAGLLWINYPANPHGRVAPREHLDAVVAWGRAHGVLVVSDECYLEFGWDTAAPSALVAGSTGVLTVHSLSKRSNLAGYRAGFVAGDASVVARLLEVRKHAGLIVPAPVQAAMVAALADDAHVQDQRERYARRRSTLRAALEQAGWIIEHSQGGLYLWATHPEHPDCWAAVTALADLGILAAPGDFYGVAGARHVRIALTATDERIDAAAARLKGAA